MLIPVVLSGGIGSRLWPLSRVDYPKQLQPLTHPELTMLQQTVLRSCSIPDIQSPLVICNEQHRFMVGEQLSQIEFESSDILLEPEGRNTAPAIALAAWYALSKSEEATLLVMPADHVIEDAAAFEKAVLDAAQIAEDGYLLTFGIVPTAPETGYGYIKAGQLIGSAYKVDQFKEKPSLALAEEYLASEDYYWNGGMFVFKASAFLAELKQLAPQIHSATKQAIQGATLDMDFIRINKEAFATSPAESIDYAIMENTTKAAMVPLNASWNDIGSWGALWEATHKDANGNAIHGDVVLHETKNSLIYAQNKLVSAVGVEDHIIVQTDDAVLVVPRNKAQNVKQIVEALANSGRSQVNHHRQVFRPWGWYDSLDAGERFQVKRILVKPGAKLSVQKHHFRAEHWVVVKGTAQVTNGDNEIILKENESTYIPIGVKHSLRNPSDDEPLEIIEVQSGSYLGEDDIVRFEDLYGRIKG